MIKKKGPITIIEFYYIRLYADKKLVIDYLGKQRNAIAFPVFPSPLLSFFDNLISARVIVANHKKYNDSRKAELCFVYRIIKPYKTNCHITNLSLSLSLSLSLCLSDNDKTMQVPFNAIFEHDNAIPQVILSHVQVG